MATIRGQYLHFYIKLQLVQRVDMLISADSICSTVFEIFEFRQVGFGQSGREWSSGAPSSKMSFIAHNFAGRARYAVRVIILTVQVFNFPES